MSHRECIDGKQTRRGQKTTAELDRIVRALREGLGLLEEQVMENVKVQSLNVAEVFADLEFS